VTDNISFFCFRFVPRFTQRSRFVLLALAAHAKRVPWAANSIEVADPFVIQKYGCQFSGVVIKRVCDFSNGLAQCIDSQLYQIGSACPVIVAPT